MTRDELLDLLRAPPPRRRLITALDVPGLQEAVGLAARLGEAGALVKVGLELFSAAGPQVVHSLRAAGREVFLDLKYHDIPNTVAAAAARAAAMGVSMCTVHAAAGRRALQTASAALATAPLPADAPGGRRPALLAVTVLTSLEQADLEETGGAGDTLAQRIARLAALAWDCGCDGLVCAAADLAAVRRAVGPRPLVVTPGIRPAGARSDDQRRVATAAEAMAAGADYLVVGRPVTRAPDPGMALAAMAAELPG